VGLLMYASSSRKDKDTMIKGIGKAYVIDPTVILLYFLGNKRASEFIDSILDENAIGYILEPCMAMLFQKLTQYLGYTDASSRLEAIKNSNIRLINIDFDLIRDAGRIKAMNPSMPMLYAYIIALAKRFNAVIVTADKNIRTDECAVEYIDIEDRLHNYTSY